MRLTQLAVPFALCIGALAGCAQPAEVPLLADKCLISARDCEVVVVNLPHNPALPTVPPGEPQMVAGFRVQARMVPENTGLGDEPMSLRAVVTVENPMSEAVTLDTGGCRLELLAYNRQGASGTRTPEVVFKQPCLFGDAPTLEPGGVVELEVQENDYYTSVALPDGRYYFELELTLSGQTVTISAGSADVRFFVPNLGYLAVTEIVGDGNAAQLRATVTVENRNDEPVLLTYGACALLVQLYRTADMTGEPVYSRVASPDGACLLYLALSEVEPGGLLRADEFAVSIPLSEIEGEVEPGYYFVQLRLELDWREKPINAGVLYVAP